MPATKTQRSATKIFSSEESRDDAKLSGRGSELSPRNFQENVS